MEKSFVLKKPGLEIPCIVTVPEHTLPRRCIIGVHGFCGSKYSKILVDLAEEMDLFGGAMVRFDFPAHGDSPVTDWAMSMKNCTDTMLAVAHKARERYPDLEMCIFATGFGAYVTLMCLEELREILGKIKLVLQTPDLHMAESLLHMAHVTEEELHQAGRVTVGKTAKRPVEISYNLYEELLGNIVYYNFGIPMLLLHGEFDDVVPLSYIEPFRRFNDQSKLVVIPGADHQFRGPGQWDMVVDLTRDWFECEQVLLCDWE